MFNEKLGERLSTDGVDLLVSYPESVGCVRYGPYAWFDPGRYTIEFDLALTGPSRDDELPRALIEVTTSLGTVLLTSRAISTGCMSESLQPFRLHFEVLERRQLEYRVHAPGNGSIVVGGARLAHDSGGLAASGADVGEASNDPLILADQVKTLLRLLTPQRATGSSKVRLGNLGDGGYICLDDFEGVDTAFSFGINDDISWDRDAADRGLTVYQFDHTVEDPAPEDSRFIFAKKMIAPNRGPDRETITDLVHRHDKGRERPNLFLKMDIENAEWRSIMATDAAELSRFSQIVCELHYFEGLADPAHRTAVFSALSRLSEHYTVVHVHANNCAEWAYYADTAVPCVLEVTFANRAIYEFEETEEIFPTSLDVSCDPNKPDMILGSFRF